MTRFALAPLLALGLAGCAVDTYGGYPAWPDSGSAPLPPAAHEWDHGPPWSEAEAPWAPVPAWASQPATSWGWSAPVLGGWVAAPTVAIGVGSGWWWGYRPWPRYGWWGPGWAPGWRSYAVPAPAWRSYGWATPGWRPPAYAYGGWGYGWNRPWAPAVPSYGWGSPGWSGGWGGRPWRPSPSPGLPPPSFRPGPPAYVPPGALSGPFPGNAIRDPRFVPPGAPVRLPRGRSL
ncbi:MAG: hypothetical protein K2X11_11405 [Acetobacteraceae bacterium]|nr:hypothetical protein [Acetobacteraceae bacterium]